MSNHPSRFFSKEIRHERYENCQRINDRPDSVVPKRMCRNCVASQRTENSPKFIPFSTKQFIANQNKCSHCGSKPQQTLLRFGSQHRAFSVESTQLQIECGRRQTWSKHWKVRWISPIHQSSSAVSSFTSPKRPNLSRKTASKRRRGKMRIENCKSSIDATVTNA